MDQGELGAGRKRGSARGAVTRLRLVEAAIATLVELGYSSTTTVEVVRRAGVSRGAMLHHFPTRADLLLATADHIMSSQSAFRRQLLRDVERGEPRFFAITDASWATMQQPEAVALIEMMLGARGDTELAERFATLMREGVKQREAGSAEVADDIGYADGRLIAAMVRLHTAAMRGLVIDRLYWGDNGRCVDDAFELLVWYKQALMRRLADPAFKREVEYDFSRPLRPLRQRSAKSRPKRNNHR